MKTVTLTQEEYNKAKRLYKDDSEFEKVLKESIENLQPYWLDGSEELRVTLKKAKLMLEKLQFEKYDLKSLELEGKGEETQITYLEKSGTPLTEDEIWDLWHDQNKLYQELIIAKKG